MGQRLILGQNQDNRVSNAGVGSYTSKETALKIARPLVVSQSNHMHSRNPFSSVGGAPPDHENSEGVSNRSRPSPLVIPVLPRKDRAHARDGTIFAGCLTQR